ncbi:MAG: TAT-variant-translocated molybdopterin oxidoreductase, partial [Bacteroidia bacterium]|nr:TAT-variant-translocated molybdopterin oxidoreductase [Bacteroidia bacterium]
MSQPKYWRGLEEWKQTPGYLDEAKNEFPTNVPLEDILSDKADEALGMTASRRDFMKVMGFGITAATLAACAEGPVKKAIPYVNKPEDIIPGVANWYASTTPSGVPVLVKTREGRPIKLEGNPDSQVTGGGLDASGQATLLDLYDQDRGLKPMKGETFMEWSDLDAELIPAFQQLAASGGSVRVLSRTLASPSAKAAVAAFLAPFGENGKHVTYEGASASAVSQAQAADFGVKAFPSYRFDRAKVIASFSCDFLGSWVSPVEFLHQWASRRSPDGEWMSRHYQIESILSNTGSNADLRFTVKPSQEGLALLNLYNKVARLLGQPTLRGVTDFNVAANGLDKLASDLVAARGASLVVSGTNNVGIQRVVNGLNILLGNYGKTVDLANPSMVHQADDEGLATLVSELRSGSVGAVILLDANPVYDTPYGEEFAAALKGMSLAVSMSVKPDETTKSCAYYVPASHFLESWGDAQQNSFSYSLVQPTIYPIFKTRQAEESLLRWSGDKTSYRDFVKSYWETNMYPQQSGFGSFRTFWEETLRKGVFAVAPKAASELTFSAEGLQALASSLGSASGSELE